MGSEGEVMNHFVRIVVDDEAISNVHLKLARRYCLLTSYGVGCVS